MCRIASCHEEYLQAVRFILHVILYTSEPFLTNFYWGGANDEKGSNIR